MGIVILDRDGVINRDSKDYIKNPEEWQPLPNSIRAISTISKKGYRIFVATNQAGIARGLFQVPALTAMHQKLFDLVSMEGGLLEGIVYCPHHPDQQCECRKPGTGMLNTIQAAAGERLAGQYFVGDSRKDIDAAIKFGCRPALVLTGNGVDTRQGLNGLAGINVFDDLYGFSDFLPDLT